MLLLSARLAKPVNAVIRAREPAVRSLLLFLIASATSETSPIAAYGPSMSSHKADVLSVQEVATNDLQNQDAARLGELGYQQGQSTVPVTIDSMLLFADVSSTDPELRREWSTLESFAISFSIISICEPSTNAAVRSSRKLTHMTRHSQAPASLRAFL